MIISKTPLRISFCGGGSIFLHFTSYQHQPGMVVSTTINKYVYITVNKKFDNLIRASYSITEFVKNPQQLKHKLIKESLLMLGVNGGIEITSISDIPSKGTGLGSSSSYTVGLLNALQPIEVSIFRVKNWLKKPVRLRLTAVRKRLGNKINISLLLGT